MTAFNLENILDFCKCNVPRHVSVINIATQAAYTGVYPVDVVEAGGQLLFVANSKVELLNRWNILNRGVIYSASNLIFSFNSYFISTIYVTGVDGIAGQHNEFSDEFSTEFN